MTLAISMKLRERVQTRIIIFKSKVHTSGPCLTPISCNRIQHIEDNIAFPTFSNSAFMQTGLRLIDQCGWAPTAQGSCTASEGECNPTPAAPVGDYTAP